MREVIEALVGSLRDEGALVLSEPAPWGDRVSVSAASSVVEVSGAPVAKAWPCLMLFGPEVIEDKTVWTPAAREQLAEDRDAATRTVRDWPASVTLRFEVVVQTRVGFTAPGTTAYWEMIAMLRRFVQWRARTPKLAGANLFLRAPLTQKGGRVTAADLHEARGSIELASVFVYPGEPYDVATTRDFVVRAGPERPGG